LKYADIWEKVLQKHETKNTFWERRASNISQVQDKLEEDRQIRMRANSNNKSSATIRGDDSFDSITMNNVNEEDGKDSLLNRRGKNGYKLPLKIFPNQRVESLPNKSDNAGKVSPYSSEKLSSFGYEDPSTSEVDFTSQTQREREIAEPLSARKKELMNASFGGAKAIPGIVESKFKVMQKKSLQEKDGQATEGQDIKSFVLNLTKQPSSSTPQKLFETKTPATERKMVKKDSFVGSAQLQSHYMPYKLESIKGKAKEKNMNSLQFERLATQELETQTYGNVKSMTINNTSRLTMSMKKSLKLGDSPPLKDFGSAKEFNFQIEEAGPKTERLKKKDVLLPKIEGISGVSLGSSRGYKSARAFQATTKSQYMKNSDYLISETSEDLATMELGTPFKIGQHASLCINTFKTADQVPQLSKIFKRMGNVVAPVENLKELQKVPTSYLRKMNEGRSKNRTIFPSHHNMFRMKPEKLHLLANSYKFDMMSPSDIRAKR